MEMRIFTAICCTLVLPGLTASVSASPFAYVPGYDAAEVQVIDVATSGKVGTTIRVGARPLGVAVAPDGAKVYVTSAGAGTVTVIDTATRSVVATSVRIGTSPGGIAIDPSGQRLYVANNGGGTVVVLDAATLALVGTPIPVGQNPTGVAITPDGRRVYVANLGSHTVSVIDTATRTTVGSAIPVGTRPAGLVIAPGGRHAYVTNYESGSVSVIDTATQTVGATVPVGSLPWGLAVAPDGSRLYVGNSGAGTVAVIDTGRWRLVDTIDPVIGSPLGMSVTPDGSSLYVVSDAENAVAVVDTARRALLRKIPLDYTGGTLALGQFITPAPAAPPAAPTGCTPTIATIPAPLTAAGGTVQLAVSGCVPSTGLSYRWSRNGSAGWGTTATLSDTLPANTSAVPVVTTYQVEVCNGSACTAALPAAPLTATVPVPPPSVPPACVSITPAQTVPPGTIVVLALNGCTAPSGGNLSYRWNVGAADGPQVGVQASYSTPPLGSTAIYYATVSADGRSTTYATTVTVGPPAPSGCTALINGGTTAVWLGSGGGSVDLTVTNCLPAAGLSFDWRRNGVAGASADSTWADSPATNSLLGPNTGSGSRISTYQVRVCNGSSCAELPATPLTAGVVAPAAAQPPAAPEPTLQPVLAANGDCATDFFIGEATLAAAASPGYWGMEVALTQEPRELTGGFNLGGAFDGGGRNPGFGAFSLSSPQRVTFTIHAQALTTPIGLVVDLMRDNATRVGGVAGTPTAAIPLSFAAELTPGFYVVRISSTASSGRGTFQLGLATTGSFAGGVVVGGYLTRAVAGTSLVGFGAFCLPQTQRARVSVFGASKYGGNAAGSLDLALRDFQRNLLPPSAPAGCGAQLATTPVTLNAAGGSARLTVVGCAPTPGRRYEWQRNGVAWSTVAEPVDALPPNRGSAPVATEYQLRVCDGRVCTELLPVVPLLAVVPPEPPTCIASIATTPSPLTADGGRVALAIAGCTAALGYTHSWSKDGVAGWSTEPNPVDTLAPAPGPGSVPTTYQAKVCNASGCLQLPPLTVTVPGRGFVLPTGCVPTVATTPSPLTHVGGSVQLGVTGCGPATGLAYAWLRNGALWSNEQHVTDQLGQNPNERPGETVYQARVCNAAGCVDVLPPLTVVVPGAPGNNQGP